MGSTPPQEDVELSDDQIQQLLLEAEGRLGGTSTQVAPVDISSIKIPKLATSSELKPYMRPGAEAVATVNSAQLIDPKQKELSNILRPASTKPAAKKDKATAGPDWFNLPKTELTSELKRDLQLIRMRSVLDPKRHYKKENGKAKIPEFSQVGTIIQGPTEFFSSRITKKDRKKNFVEEVLAAERQNHRFESKYRDIQANKTSGKKAFYKELQAKRNRKLK
ncbi:rRNA-processing protein [Penicillium ucsense]|uniref:rRNA-processing protein n=1 Tax=Penicillium ucsense TaxID=2839758 RepID=A0A8J8W1F8_9EURO|nr:rRNA-processing protein [Penicillium ucsense]KAF7733673.1 rRNA-processing protein [Penicillium ucsense]